MSTFVHQHLFLCGFASGIAFVALAMAAVIFAWVITFGFGKGWGP